MGVSLSLHAGRQLSGKGLRYLKRVIVTPAVYRRFTPLNRGFTDRHWAGLSPRTHPYGLAGTYVSIKQSDPPSHCDQPSARLAPLLPKLRGQFAEFPRPGCPRHALGYSPRDTSVGSRYGRLGSFPVPFSRAPELGRTLLREGHSCFHPVLAITALPGLIQLDAATAALGLPRGVGDWACVAASTQAVPEY